MNAPLANSQTLLKSYSINLHIYTAKLQGFVMTATVISISQDNLSNGLTNVFCSYCVSPWNTEQILVDLLSSSPLQWQIETKKDNRFFWWPKERNQGQGKVLSIYFTVFQSFLWLKGTLRLTDCVALILTQWAVYILDDVWSSAWNWKVPGKSRTLLWMNQET